MAKFGEGAGGTFTLVDTAKFDPTKTTLSAVIEKFDKSDYDSALLVQIADDILSFRDTVGYQNFINKFKCISN